MRARVAGRHPALVALAGAAVLMRLAYLRAPEGNDEGGYLAVASQWHGPGPSLYGHYWVDRPPLLIALFQLASALGGLAALRVLAALAAGVTVLGVAATCRHVAGCRAAVCSAAIAAALFASPQLGTVQVNGELLAAPFVAWSIAMIVVALGPSGGWRTAPAFGAGALAVAALLVKQNMAEPVVFGIVSVLVSWRAGLVGRSEVRRIASGAGADAVAALVVAAGWTLLHGSSLLGVFEATYLFRVRAVTVLTTVHDLGQMRREDLLVHAFVASGVLLVIAAFAWAVVRRRLSGPLAWGLSLTLAWAIASMLLGGGFWDHYLVEMIVPTAVAGGFALGGDAGRHPRPTVLPALAAGLVVAVALTHWVGGLADKVSERGVAVGTAIAAVATPGDTLVSAVGDAETVQASGLSSPYPYLWTLPAQVDDPGLDHLVALLEGREAPTWLVSWNRPSFSVPIRERLQSVVALRYHVAGTVCGQPVLLRNGVVRPALPQERCEGRLTAMPVW